MRTSLTITLFLFTALICLGQDLGVIEDSKSRIFEIVDHRDTIEFIKIDKNLETPNPVIIVLQGSLPIPLAIRYPEGSLSSSTRETVE
jgi:hypothetical protein